MSFTMQNIKRKTTTKQDDIKSCYFYVNSHPLITDNVKLAIWKYCDYRFKKRSNGRLTAHSIDIMIRELLEKVCLKSYNEISINDIYRNESEILYHIKRAIFFGATKNLYYNIDTEKQLDYLYSTDVELSPPKPGTRLTEDEVIDYFKDLMI